MINRRSLIKCIASLACLPLGVHALPTPQQRKWYIVRVQNDGSAYLMSSKGDKVEFTAELLADTIRSEHYGINKLVCIVKQDLSDTTLLNEDDTRQIHKMISSLHGTERDSWPIQS